MTPEDAWDALDAALEDYEPPCRDDPLFTTAERLSPADHAFCEALCAGCMVIDLCDTYATTADVRMGFWGGHRHTQKGKQPAGPRTRPGPPRQASHLGHTTATTQRDAEDR